MILSPNRLLRLFGLEIRRIDRPAVFPPPPVGELTALESILATFASSMPTGSACADFDALRSYLDNRRIALFHSLIEVARRAGVEFDGRHVVDVGTGTGYLLRVIAQLAQPASLAGFDTFEEMLGLARLLNPQARIELRSLYAIDETFDLVMCTETLEHLVDPGRALEALYSIVTPGGSLLLSVPDGRHDRLACGERRADGSSYWGHIHFWSPESWSLFLAPHFADDVEIRCDRLSTGENFAAIRKPANR